MLGRYALYDEIASGGMAAVHYGRLVGAGGFARSVAIKRLHPQYAKDPEFVAMFLDEARLAARIRHPNVVPTIDVVSTDDELFLVMEYVHGESLARLRRALARSGEQVPPAIAVAIAVQTLAGLHAAHEAKSERGAPLAIIHRDVSPQNILVGEDGVARIVDFGVAKASWRYQSTREGQIKGKLAYMAPEQLRPGADQDRRVDVYAASVVLWEALAGKRYLEEDHPGTVLARLQTMVAEAPSKHAGPLPAGLDEIVLRGLAREPAGRWKTANEMAIALEKTVSLPSAREIGEWVGRTAGEVLEKRMRVLTDIESVSSMDALPVATPEDDAIVVEHAPLPRADPHTSVSGVRQPSAVPSAPSRRTRVILAAAVVGVAIAGVGAWMAFGRAPRAPAAAAGSENAAPSPPPASTATPVPTAPVAISAASSAPPASPPAAVTTAVRPASNPPPSPRPTAKPGCTPPYTIDRDGVRIPKPGCLR